MEKNHNYYYIIPSHILYDKNLKANEKLLYGQIYALKDEHGYCFASNRYFAEKNKTSITSISTWISCLSKNNNINVVYDESGIRKIFIPPLP